jgi:hypothetical protein
MLASGVTCIGLLATAACGAGKYTFTAGTTRPSASPAASYSAIANSLLGPASAPADQGSGDCLFGANGADVEVGIGDPASSCAQWITDLAGSGLNWYDIPQMATPGSQGTADQETMGVACDLTDGTEELFVEDAGGMTYGNSICSSEERNGWTPESPAGPLESQAQGAQEAAQAQANAQAQASASAAAVQASASASAAQVAQVAQDVQSVNSDAQGVATAITTYNNDVKTAEAALAQVKTEPLCSNGSSDQQTYDDAQNVYDDGQTVYDDETQMADDLSQLQSAWSQMVSDNGGSVPSGVGQASAEMKAAESINPGANTESTAIQNAASNIQNATDNCS